VASNNKTYTLGLNSTTITAPRALKKRSYIMTIGILLLASMR